MRDIKFRGVRTENNNWIYGSLICREKGFSENENEYSAIIIFDKGLDSNYNAYLELEVIYKSIGQFTGLKDKNGVDIYEGDVLGGYPHGSVIVKWDDKFACFSCYDLEDNTDYGLFSNEYDNCKDEWLVIGNIHQNPELLTN